MSTSPEADFNLELHFLPAWAQEPPKQNQYAKFAGEPEREDDRRRDGQNRPPRRREGPSAREPGPRDRQARGPRPPFPGKGGGQRGRDDRRSGSEQDRREQRGAPLPPPLEINVAFKPDDKGVDSLTRQIKMTGRAYPLFDIAQMILQKPERHSVTFSVRKKPDGQPVQPLFVCAIDDTLWISEEEAVHYVLNKHFNLFYQPERTAIDAPKGTYTFVAQCGLSGVVLGPPNHHDYQNQLRKLHAERFSRMPFDAFKARVKIVRDEAVVKKWLDEQSWKTEYVCLNLPEPLKLASREEVEKHFRETHLPNIIKPVDSFNLGGAASRNLRSAPLLRLLRHCWEDQQRFPLQIATVLSQQFAARGLQFFKVNKTVTHVAVARPHYLDMEATPVSDGVRRIVDYINAHPKCSHRQLLDALAPLPAPAVVAEPVPAAVPAEQAQASPELTALISDLHWLIHQGHVIEFANGRLEMAKKAPPRPEKPPASVTPLPTAESIPALDSASAGAATSPAGSTEPAAPALSDEPVTSQALDATTPEQLNAVSSTEQEPNVETEAAAKSDASPTENPDQPTPLAGSESRPS